VEASLAQTLRPAVKVATARHGAIDAAVLLGLAAGAEDDLEARPSHHDQEEDHDHDEFESFVVEIEPLATVAGLTERLRQVIAAHGILRLKGFLPVAGKEMRLVVQAVGDRVQHYFDRDWTTEEERSGRLVVIGFAGLDRTAIAAALQA
jgi:cobalamin biosynthesis protein CobW